MRHGKVGAWKYGPDRDTLDGHRAMKVRWWPHTRDPQIASTRLRCLHVIDALQQQCNDIGLYASRERAPDVLVLAKRYDSASLARARQLQSRGTRLVLDLCDNHFYCDPPMPGWIHRAELLRGAVASVDAVITSTRTLGDVVREECPGTPPLYVIGDAVEPPYSPTVTQRWWHPVDEWALRKLAARTSRFRASGGVPLLWFGNHGSDNAEGGMRDLLRLRNALQLLAKRQKIALTVISNRRETFEAVARDLPLPTTYLPWNAYTFSRAAALHDIALLPISRNPFTLCKTSNRVATALIHGLAVAADIIPSYCEFSDSILLDDWYAGLQEITSDANRRRSMVERGRQHISARWGMASIADQWRATLFAIAKPPKTPGGIHGS